MSTPLVGVAGLLLLAGCAALGGSAAEVRTYRMAYQPPERAAGAPLPVTVRLAPFGVASVYDRQSFMYRHDAYGISADYYNRWVASPASIIGDLIARDLATSGTVEGVLQSPSALPAAYELSGHIDTLEERDEDDGCSAHVRLRVTLVRVPPRRARYIVFQEGLVADEPCTRGDPTSYAEATSRAVERLSGEIRTAVVEAIRRDWRAEPSTQPADAR
jgi:ABC-type uncharacterized transport system auxiliary subunit